MARPTEGPGIQPETERGVFITLEGGEGAGKSTQTRLLQQRLVDRGHAVFCTREPGGSPRAERLREAILSGQVRALGPEAETIVFAAARADHLRRTIWPRLRAGHVVICDRFIDSTRVYQGAVAGVTPSVIRGLERVTLAGTLPDLTLILDLPAELGSTRAAGRRAGQGDVPDRFEQESLGFHERVRTAFLALAVQEPERCHVVDASRAEEEVATDIWAAVSGRLPDALSPAARSA